MAINLWPALGKTVLDHNGDTISTSGVSLGTLTEFYSDLIVAGVLLTFDPLDTGDPTVAPTDSATNAVASYLSAELAALAGTTDGQAVIIKGRSAVGDGGEGVAVWDADSVETADNATVWGSGTGRWIRVRQDKLYYHADWFGVIGNGVSDDRDNVQAAIDALPLGATLEFAGRTYVFNPPQRDVSNNIQAGKEGSIVIDRARNANHRALRLVGQNGTASNIHKTTFQRVGTDNETPLMWLASDRCLIKGIYFRSGTNASSSALLQVGETDAADATTINFNRIEECGFERNGGIIGATEFLVRIGGTDTQQLENTTFRGCIFIRPSVDCVHLAVNSQPYTTTFQDCQFFGAVSNTAPFGRGVRIRSNSASATFINCDFQQLESAVAADQPVPVQFFGCQFEHNKRIINWSHTTGSASSVLISGGRLNTSSIGYASSGPDVYPDYDHRFIFFHCGGTLQIDQVEATTRLAQRTSRLSLGVAAKLVINGGTFPSSECIERVSGVTEPAGIVVNGAVAPNDSGGNFENLPAYSGRENPPGRVTVYGAATTAVVALPFTEPNTNYHVELVSDSVSGSVAAGSSRVRVSAKTTTSFTITVETAPGAGTSVTYAYRILPSGLSVTTPSTIQGLVAHWRSSSGISETAGTLNSWTDVVSSRLLNTDAGTPAYSASDANLNSLPSIAMAVGGRLLSSEAASAWNFMHNGTSGFTLIAVMYTASDVSSGIYVVGTKSSSSSAAGVGVSFNSATNMSVVIANGTGSTTITRSGSPNGKTFFAARFETEDNNGYLRNKSQTDWGDTSFVGFGNSAGDAQSTLRVQGPLLSGTIYVAEILVYNRALTKYQFEQLLTDYLAPRYGGF
jgi:hypothetical protein